MSSRAVRRTVPALRVPGLVPARSLVLVAALGVGLAGCSGDGGGGGEGGASPGEGAGASQSAAPVRTRVVLGQVPGRLGHDARRRVTSHVGDVVDRWFDAAFVGGRYPRRDFRDSFPGFTAGAAAQARHDQALMTNAPLGPRVDDVRATARRVWVDVLPAGGRAAGATARFRLAFTTSGEVQRDVVVRGRLMLAPGPHGWQVFGYDVAKGSAKQMAPPPTKHADKQDGKQDGKHGGKRSGSKGGKR